MATLIAAGAFLITIGSSGGAIRTVASTKPNLAFVAARVARFRGVPKFAPPGPVFAAAKARGKSIFMIPLSSSIPFITEVDQAEAQVAKVFGVSFKLFPNQGQPSEWIQGMNEATAEKATLIDLDGDPKLLRPQIAAALNAGVRFILTAYRYDASAASGTLGGVPPGIRGLVNVPARNVEAATLDVDYMISASKGHAHILLVTSNDLDIARRSLPAIQSELAKYCGKGCSLNVVNVNSQDWATKIQGAVQVGLLAHPDTNYVFPIYDGMIPWTVAGVKAAGRSGKVGVVTFNGTPSVLKMIASGEVTMDIGESPVWMGWAAMDQALRVMTGHPAVKSENTPLRIFDRSNVSSAGVPPVPTKGYGSAYIQGYKKLWGLR